MKYIKLFEYKEEGPQIGDYVICCDNIYKNDSYLTKFLSSAIGQVISVDTSCSKRQPYEIKFNNIPSYLNHYFNFDEEYRWMRRDEILFYSSNREYCEVFLTTDKYNI